MNPQHKLTYKFNTSSVSTDEIDNDITTILMDRYELNICNRCNMWQKSATEMYWVGDECTKTTELLNKYDYTAVCDECFDECFEEDKANGT